MRGHDDRRFDLERHFFFWVTQVMGSRDRHLGRALRELGLKVPEWRVLAALQARRGCSMRDLAELTTIDRTTLSRTIDRMAAAGSINRLQDVADARVTRVVLPRRRAKIRRRAAPVWHWSTRCRWRACRRG